MKTFKVFLIDELINSIVENEILLLTTKNPKTYLEKLKSIVYENEILKNILLEYDLRYIIKIFIGKISVEESLISKKQLNDFFNIDLYHTMSYTDYSKQKYITEFMFNEYMSEIKKCNISELEFIKKNID